ncbi:MULTISPECIES: FAD-binding oxidoreductase [Bacillus]|uniref:FAD-binding protein n=2 Tax=Bacillus TaxID=1386 RepID=A0A0M5JAU8_9BACI|nr:MULTISPECIES: FAD-binding oxidoreductase [Bacillus]ALC83644.1 FAD-binding protein [Bacillus gobiensis]MBP1082662.1 FAD/FMN-containing dehydrogenase [Bacillus capparidis]MED1097111.1 FAD-binding oxidoreductase [Bacillus capparidis]
MKKKWIVIGIILVFYLSMFFYSIQKEKNVQDPALMTDVSRLMPVKVKQVTDGSSEATLLDTIKEAKEKNLKVSIAGKQHSMGGHTYYKDGIVLDMTGYNKILEIDKQNKTITVQSGATWNDIQQAVNPYGLAVKVMQSQNIFTIGGSLSVNAHGRDIRYGSLIDTVRSFRLLNADGKIITVNRDDELFSLVLGGYGLFGVILDVELELTDDELYAMNSRELDYKEYTDYFKENVLNRPDVRMHLARISTAKSSFLKEMYVTDYVLTDQSALGNYNKLKEDELTGITKFSLGLARNNDFGKDAFWNLQKSHFIKESGKQMTRNNVMRSESKFLEYENESNTDVLQEYFVPVDHFEAYIDELRSALSAEEFNLVNITIRYVQKNENAVLSYAKSDMFALVLLINQGLSPAERTETERIVQKMIDVTLNHDGSYYLPYMNYPTNEQMEKAYPRKNEFFKKKLQYDPEERFTNYFYERYK